MFSVLSAPIKEQYELVLFLPCRNLIQSWKHLSEDPVHFGAVAVSGPRGRAGHLVAVRVGPAPSACSHLLLLYSEQGLLLSNLIPQ